MKIVCVLLGVISLGMVLLLTGCGQKNPGVVGDWEGDMQAGPSTLHLVVHIQKLEDGTLTGSMDSPSQNANGLKLEQVTAGKESLSFIVPLVGGSYKGTIHQDTIEGNWTQSGNTFPLKLTRQ